MSSLEARAYATDHPHSHHHNRPVSPKSSHGPSFSTPLHPFTSLIHAPSAFLGTVHHHEREMAINHQQRLAKKEAVAAINKSEAGTSTAAFTSTNSARPSNGATRAARAAMGAGATEEDEAQWAAIVAARAAATKRSAMLDLEKAMAEERRRRVLEEIELQS